MMNTLDVINEILKANSEIEYLTFSKYPKQVPIQDKIKLSTIDETFISNALDIRDKLKFPFWDCLMASLFDKKAVSQELLNSTLLHNKNKENIRTRDIDEISKILKKNPTENLSLNSEINFKDNNVKHFFLLDFHIFASDNNLKIVSKIIKAIGLTGYILNSGDSYHFISDTFFGIESMIDLLAKSLLFSPIVDRAWVAHQILERSCSIRVGQKHSIIPFVVDKV